VSYEGIKLCLCCDFCIANTKSSKSALYISCAILLSTVFYCFYVFSIFYCYCIDVRLSHLNKDYLLTYLLTCPQQLNTAGDENRWYDPRKMYNTLWTTKYLPERLIDDDGWLELSVPTANQENAITRCAGDVARSWVVAGTSRRLRRRSLAAINRGRAGIGRPTDRRRRHAAQMMSWLTPSSSNWNLPRNTAQPLNTASQNAMFYALTAPNVLLIY